MPLPLPPRLLAALVTLLVCGAAIARFAALTQAQPVDRGPAWQSIARFPEILAADSSDLSAPATQSGIDRVDRLRFDRSAPVILTFGGDGQPGQATVDDNRDGVVDNKSEIGAVGSDDRCLAPWDRDYDQAKQQRGTIAISKGTFVPDDHASADAAESRTVVHGSNATGRWSWMVVP